MNLNNRSNYKHDISMYTDDEIFEILELDNSCTNQELETRIIGLIKKYNEINTDTAKQFTRFFTDMYDRFFEYIISEEDDDENEEIGSVESIFTDTDKSDIHDNDNDSDNDNLNDSTMIIKTDKNNKNDFHKNNILAPPLNTRTPFFKEGFETKEEPASVEKISDQKVEAPERLEDKSVTVNQVAYKKDNVLNPIRIQTIKRIVNIDSQYRDERYPLSTEFTFNLNEPLRETVSIRLYSITIPYTWYTILNTYGGNFFYLKGVSDGINNGDFDYKIEIKPGTYDQQNLINAIQTQIVNLKTTVTDVSFGNTSIVYNEPLGKATINLDYSKYYTESSYKVSFLNEFGDELPYKPNDISYVSDVYFKELRYTKSVQAFLGFNYSTYSTTVIQSHYLPSIQSTSTLDNTASIYDLYDDNKTFHIYIYQGSTGFIKNSTPIIKDIEITLPLLNGSYSRKTLETVLHAQLSTHPLLSNSYIERKDISDINAQNYGYSQYYINIKLNKHTTPVLPNIKVVVEFPNVTYYSNNQYNNIWLNGTNTISCFAFSSQTIEVSDIQAETKTLQTSYRIFPNTYIDFKCIAPGYQHPTNITPFIDNSFSSFNNVRINLYDPAHNGLYTFRELITHVNNCFQTTNNAVDIFAMSNTSFFENSSTSLLEFNIDIAKTFTNNDYYVDLSGIYKFSSIPSKRADYINYANIDLSNTSIISWSEPAPVRFTANTKIVIYPKQTSTNKNVAPFIIPIQFANKNLSELNYYINSQLQNFSHNNLNPLIHCLYSCELNAGTVVTTFRFNIINTLQETNYTMTFNEGSSTDISGVWTKIFFNTNSPYTLANPDEVTYSKLTNNNIISDYTLNLDSDQIIRFTAIDNGVMTTNGTYDIDIYIESGLYTREQLLQHINTQLDANLFTTGSYLSVEEFDSNNYIVFHVNINKKFISNDYKIVFYDSVSFVKCYFGTKSVRNTTWDSTLGWVLGFKDFTEYDLSTYTSTNGIVSITGEASVVTNIYNNCFLVLDDYTQSHINDGLITLTSKDTDIALPSYASRTNITCDPITGKKIYVNPLQSVRQNYSVTQILQSKIKRQSQYSITPFVKDIFALIPIKVPSVGNTYTEFGGTLQNQERMYFGPVTLQRMTVKLVNDKGDLLDLNGSNWTFSFICEQLYNMATT